MELDIGDIHIDNVEGITEMALINTETGEIVQFAHMEQFHGRDEEAQEFRDALIESAEWANNPTFEDDDDGPHP